MIITMKRSHLYKKKGLIETEINIKFDEDIDDGLQKTIAEYLKELYEVEIGSNENDDE